MPNVVSSSLPCVNVCNAHDMAWADHGSLGQGPTNRNEFTRSFRRVRRKFLSTNPLPHFSGLLSHKPLGCAHSTSAFNPRHVEAMQIIGIRAAEPTSIGMER